MEQIDKMRDAFGKLVDEAGARTREEVDNVKKQCNQNISKLMEEIHTLELVRIQCFLKLSEESDVRRSLTPDFSVAVSGEQCKASTIRTSYQGEEGSRIRTRKS